MPIILRGRVMSVGLKPATAETKDRAAKEELVEVEVYVARQRMEIVQAPAAMLRDMEDLEGEEYGFECASYTPWAVGNKVGISFKLLQVLDDNYRPVDLAKLRQANRQTVPPPQQQTVPPRQPVAA